MNSPKYVDYIYIHRVVNHNNYEAGFSSKSASLSSLIIYLPKPSKAIIIWLVVVLENPPVGVLVSLTLPFGI